MEIRLAFGKTGLAVELPAGFRYEILEARSAEALADAKAAVERALDAPIGSPPLETLAGGKTSAAISVCDITRPVPNRWTLPPVLERLEQAGIPRDQVTICIATGLHRAATKEELDEILGPEIARTVRVTNHDARRREDHRFLGKTAGGIPVYIDERFMAADLHLTLGFIEPHLMLGFSGGRKLIAPGLAAQETIRTIHAPRFMRDPLATEGSIERNPLHSALLEIARMAGHHFAVDVALTRTRALAGVFAGDPVEAHAAGVEFVRRSQSIDLEGFADAVITTAAGYPLDLTFYQTVKGVTAAAHQVRPGGRILILSECAEGVGSPEFAAQLTAMKSCGDFLREIERAPVEVDQWQLEKLALVLQHCDVLFCAPGVKATQMGCLAGQHFTHPDAALEAFFRGLPRGAKVAVVPEGPYAFAQVSNAAAAAS